MTLTYALLALSLCAVWLPPVRFAGRHSLPPWLPLFALAVASGLAAEYVRPAGLLSLALLGLVAHLTGRKDAARWEVWAFGTVTVLLSLALAMHRLPGFNNPTVITGEVFSAGSVPFTLYANFDKGAVGLLLLALLCRRVTSLAELGDVIRKTWLVAISTIAAVMGLALLIHFVRPDFKLPAATWIFMLVNLFFTVIAEEAFFRGFIQDRITVAIGSTTLGIGIAIAASALLFGVAHFTGGLAYAGLATIAGVGYAFAYHRTRRIEGAIATHFLLNAIHFVGFSYPFLK